jgi:hypothetical protein
MRFMGWAMRSGYRRPKPPLHTRLRGMFSFL